MKIVYNIYVAVRKLWNAIFGKNGDGSQLVIPGRISGASGDVTLGDNLELVSNVLDVKDSALTGRVSGATGDVTIGGALDLTDNQLTAKKLYWHGIIIYDSSLSSKNNIRGFIINNSSEPINDIAKLDAWFKSIDGQVDLAVIGYTEISAQTTPTAISIVLRKSQYNQYSIVRLDNNSIVNVPIGSSLYALFNTVVDSTNALN